MSSVANSGCFSGCKESNKKGISCLLNKTLARAVTAASTQSSQYSDKTVERCDNHTSIISKTDAFF